MVYEAGNQTLVGEVPASFNLLEIGEIRNVYEYIKYLLTEMPNNAQLEHTKMTDQYLPWSEELAD